MWLRCSLAEVALMTADLSVCWKTGDFKVLTQGQTGRCGHLSPPPRCLAPDFGTAPAGHESLARPEATRGTSSPKNSTKDHVHACYMKAFSLRAFSFGCFESLFSVALLKLVFNLLFSLWVFFIFILLYQKSLDFIPIPALLAFWSLIFF